MTTRRTSDELETAARAGEWLSVGDAAKLLNIGRSTLDKWLKTGQLRYQENPINNYRTCHPDDIIELLTRMRKIHGNPV